MDIMLVLMRKKPGMKKIDFINHYETQHVPLVLSLIGQYIHSYERDYLDYSHKYSKAPIDGKVPEVLPLDVITRVVWKDLEAARHAMADPKNAAAIAADEENFLDRATIQVVIVPDGHSRLTVPAVR